MKRFALLIFLLALAGAGPVQGQATYPDRPVHLVVPYGAGGNFDNIARLLAKHLTERWKGTPVVIDNKPGANGNIGTAEVSRSSPDGYTLALVSNGTYAINPGLYKSLGFDPVNGLTPISIVASNPMVLVVGKSQPFKNVQELIEYAKANPGKLNLANGGNGTLSHLSAEMLESRTGTNIVTVPYKSTAAALTGVLAGDVQGMFDTIGTSIPQMKSGAVRGLAVTSPGRFPTNPELPSMVEVGVKDCIAEPKAGLFGPPGMPRAMVDRIRNDVVAVLQKPEVREKLLDMGVEPVGTTPEELAADIKAETNTWGDIIRAAGVKAE